MAALARVAAGATGSALPRLWLRPPAPGIAALAPAAAGPCRGPLCQDTRSVARVRINRYTGVRALKVGVGKTEWQIQAEKEFLASRESDVPQDAYIWGLTEDDVRNLSAEMQHALSMRCGNAENKYKWRVAQLIKKFAQRPNDRHSPAVKIARYTEKILRLRAHLLRRPKQRTAKMAMTKYLSIRMKCMKSLYKVDYTLYRHVCTELGIRCIRFAIPNSRDPQRMYNPQAVDGDRARFMIRQRMYRARFRPREMRDPRLGKLIRYTRHPMEPVPESHGKPQPIPQQVSLAWPYSVTPERVAGKQVIYNPTAAGKGFWPTSAGSIGGSTPK